MNKKLLTMNEAAELLSIKVSGLRALLFRREIPVIKVGRRNRFSPEALANWLQARTRKELK